jgi:hypothetical protein
LPKSAIRVSHLKLWYTPLSHEERSWIPPERNPVDHWRTFRQHAGETVTHGPHAPGVYGTIVAASALVIGLFAFATGHAFVGSTAVIVAVALGAASAAWLLRSHHNVRDAEVRWHEAHSDDPAPPPAS